MLYTIDKRSHVSRPSTFKLVWSKTLTKKVIFDYDCKYDLRDSDQSDVNKLFGVGFFPHHHKNSARFGWRWNIHTQSIEIFSYVYSKGIRKIQHLTDLRLGVQYELSLYIEKDHYFFLVKDMGGWTKKALLVESKNTFPLIGYFLKPYFGGNKRAPHKMSIILK